MGKRHINSPAFKARIAMEAISCRKAIQEIATDHAIHQILASQWKKQLLEGASELPIRGKKIKDKEAGQAKEAELFQQIRRLQMELAVAQADGQLMAYEQNNLTAALYPGHCYQQDSSSWAWLPSPCSSMARSVSGSNP
jgi:transposase